MTHNEKVVIFLLTSFKAKGVLGGVCLAPFTVQYYPEKHDCIFRNIRLYISVWDSIFQNIKISSKIQRNIQRNLQIFRNILPVFLRIFFKNPVLYCRIFRNIPRFLRIFLVFPPGFFFLDFIIFHNLGPYFSDFF